MSDNLDHYLLFSTYTNPGLYKDKLIDLPSNIKDIGLLVRKSLIHRTTLRDGNTGSNVDLKYGDMTKVPWWRQPEDDILVTAAAMLAELYRRDAKGLHLDRSEENKLILTCRFTAVLMASILKSKGIPARVRSGFASYFPGNLGNGWDHWINQYWDIESNRWVTIDVDGCLHDLFFDPFDIPDKVFDYSAKAWLDVRQEKVSEDHFQNAGGTGGLRAIAWELFYDFHCLMNNEINYVFTPEFIHDIHWARLRDEELKEIDALAEVMLEPDKNFAKLLDIWNMNRKFRIMKGPLL